MRTVLPLLLSAALLGCQPDADGDGSSPPDDCDDADPSIHPGAAEVCDGIDQDCDGEVDEGALRAYYLDVDGDGVGDPATEEWACSEPAGFVSVATDCDDRDAGVYPGAPERCNGEDDDCDGGIDEDLAVTWYADADADGWGDAADSVDDCAQPPHTSALAGDCDETDPGVHPDAVEICDGVDQDCDGAADNGFDLDGDGFLAGEGCEEVGDLDCDDGDAAVHPDAEEICGDGIDQNCEGTDADCAFGSAFGLAGATGRVDGPSASAWAGRGLDAGDMDGDGLADLLVGAMGYDGGRGIAGLTSGPIVGTHTFGEGATLTSPEASGGAGRDVAVGDVDGDGLADLFVGIPYDSAVAPGGGAYLVYGPVRGARSLGEADASVLGAGSSELAGHSLDLGDLDGDGAADLVVGVYAERTLSEGGGAVFVTYGAVTGEITTTDADGALLGSGDPGYAGHMVRAGRDLTGDGVGDLLVTAVGDTGLAPPSGGLVYLAEGPLVGVLEGEDAWATFAGEAARDYAGQGLAAGDLDGDGRDDLLVGAPGADGNAGVAYAVFAPVPGAFALADADARWLGGRSGRYAGSALAAGDLDGDGAADLLLGAPGDDTAGTDAGAACVFLGPVSAGSHAISAASLALTGASAQDAAGDGLGIADLDGDGVGELLLGAAYASGGGSAAGAVFVVAGAL